MRISDWRSDVCSSDLADDPRCLRASERAADAVGAFAAQRTLQEHGFAPPGVAAQVQLRLSDWRRPLRAGSDRPAPWQGLPAEQPAAGEASSGLSADRGGGQRDRKSVV